MAIQVFLAKATTTVITALAGVTAYEILKKGRGQSAASSDRGIGSSAGSARNPQGRGSRGIGPPKGGDVMAEARERIGEESPTPAISDLHDHDH